MKRNSLVGGFATFGANLTPVPLYEGPTDRAIIKKMLTNGESICAIPKHGATGSSDAGSVLNG